MSPGPGRIERVIDVAIPRPHGLDVRRNRGFLRHEEGITAVFLDQGVLRR